MYLQHTTRNTEEHPRGGGKWTPGRDVLGGWAWPMSMPFRCRCVARIQPTRSTFLSKQKHTRSTRSCCFHHPRYSAGPWSKTNRCPALQRFENIWFDSKPVQSNPIKARVLTELNYSMNSASSDQSKAN
jgi:hypothetical protein